MAKMSTVAVAALTELLSGPDGLPARIEEATVSAGCADTPLISAADIVARHVAADLAEKTSGVRYPSVHVYCDKVVNELREKFRRFSGTATLIAEVRVSHEHMEPLQGMLQLYAEAVTDVLDGKRGHWAPGVFYTGGYTVQYGPIKRGGRNFLQSAKVELTVNGSVG
jgi:hypothetical protein